MEQGSYEPISTVEELTSWMRDEALKRRVDPDSSPRSLRIAWEITDAVTDDQILNALTATFRSNRSPFAVLLGGGMIVACAEVGRDEDIDADGLDRLEESLCETQDGDVRLSKADSRARGHDVLIAYRMPPRQWPYLDGPYRAGDEDWVKRFGVEVGRYRRRRTGR
ncbi:hypothetical protein EON79_06860 [bacterium]|nr:MAG: hypothetical protein EON79_06860 [bacterium]